MYGVLSGKEKSPFNIFIDENLDQSLKYGIIKEFVKSEKDTVVLCYQESKKSYQRLLTSSHRLIYIDEFSDPLSWVGKNVKSIKCDIKSHILQRISHSGVSNLQQCTIFIDDVILFGRAYGLIDQNGEWTEQCLNVLLQLSKEIPVFLYIKSMLLDTGIIKSLQYSSSFYANFIPSNTILSKPAKCECIFRKKSGKVVAEVFSYQMQRDGVILFTKNIMNKLEDDNNSLNQESDPSSNLTFNLRLTQSEQDAKDKTVLPYLLKEESKVTMLRKDNNKGGKGGEIIYTPDDLDDFDDEDPDDDLDI